MRPYRYFSIIFIVALLAGDYIYFMIDGSIWWLVVPFVVYLNLLVLGTIFIRWNFYMRSYNSSQKKDLVALTFDDGPGQETAMILDVLKAHEVPAAFFSIGKHAAGKADLVKRWDSEGHVIGSHSYHHGFNFDWKSSRKMIKELEETNNTIKNTIGKTPKLFRPPYGVTNPNLAKAVKHMNMHSIGWSIRSFDTTAKDPKELLERILFRIEGGDIILLHDTVPITREILTDLIKGVRQKGFTFARVDKMLDIDAYA